MAVKKEHLLTGLLLLAATGLLAGCGGTASAAEVTEVPVVASDAAGTVVAEAVIEPARSEDLSFEMGGTVVDVMVEKGDAVKAGDVLARLETVDLDRALAQADLSLAQAQLRLEQLEEPADEDDIAAADSALADAQAAYGEAVKNLRLTEDGVAVGDDVRAARFARDETYRVYQELQSKFDRNEPWIEQHHVDQAHDAYRDAEGAYQRAVQNSELQLLSARNAVARANRAIEQAQRDLAELQEGSDALDVEAAQLDIQAAELALEQAQDALKDATLVAPFDGVISTRDVDVADIIAPGQPVVTMATLGQLQAKTKDLTELDVVRVEVGQTVVVTIDALPGEEFQGTVSEIALQPGDYRGDVVYTVTVDLLDVEGSPLRWGMTALVEIDAE
jgi:multidrug efflux pump subunit AcrA (membrane-fusion protein)